MTWKNDVHTNCTVHHNSRVESSTTNRTWKNKTYYLFFSCTSFKTIHKTIQSFLHAYMTGWILFRLFRRFSTDFWPFWDQCKSVEKLDQYVGGYAFYTHPKLPQNGQKWSFSAPVKFTARIHPVWVQPPLTRKACVLMTVIFRAQWWNVFLPSYSERDMQW